MKYILLIAALSLGFETGAFAKDDTHEKYIGSDSTKIDFEAMSIDGKMKAPQGFFLQGRKKQSLSEMVKLRSNFRRELRSAGKAMRAIAK